MKHSIFEPGLKDSVFDRIDAITPDTTGKWGKLTATQMIRHLSEANRLAFGEITMPDRSNLFTRTLLKWIVLSNIKPPGREKGKIKTFPEVDIVQSRIAVDDTETEKRRYKATVNRMINTPILHPVHTLFGKMTRDDWGYLVYSHADYHLTQFNH